MADLPVNEIICGDALAVLRTFPADSVDCCVGLDSMGADAIQSTVRELTEYEKGWLEAAIDGEGSLSVVFQKQNTSDRPRVAVCLSIAGTDRRFLEKAQAICGGGSISTKTPVGNRKTPFSFVLHAGILRQILPQINLLIKSRQQALCLEAMSLLGEPGGYGSMMVDGRRVGRKRPLWKDQRFAEIKAEMNALNMRGVGKSDPRRVVDSRCAHDN